MERRHTYVSNDRYVREADGRCRREADLADLAVRGLNRGIARVQWLPREGPESALWPSFRCQREGGFAPLAGVSSMGVGSQQRTVLWQVARAAARENGQSVWRLEVDAPTADLARW
jgi:hypothetical protein